MENASKALIIAGAILVAILLISIGVLIINQINPVTDEVGNMGASTAAKTFNSNFTQYEGEGKRSAEVKTLVNNVNSSQGTRTVTLTWESGLSVVKLKNNATYTIEYKYDSEGYICEARIYTDGKTAPNWQT